MPAINRLTALGLYKAVTTDLDKTQSASFSVTQFNYWANREQLGLQADLVDVFERTQVMSDFLSPFIKRQVYGSAGAVSSGFRQELTAPTVPSGTNIESNQSMPLPADYEMALQTTAVFTAKEAFGAYRQADKITRSPKRLTADQQAYIEEPNHYFKPTFDRTYRRIVGNRLEVYSGVHSKLVLTQCTLEYVKRPEAIVLYESDVTDLTNDHSQMLEWSVKASYELAKYITRALMEQSGNQRLQSYVALNQLNVGSMPQPQQQMPAQRAAQQDQQAQQYQQ